MKKVFKFILPAVLVALIAVIALAGCTGNTEVREGTVSFVFEMIDADGMVTQWELQADASINLGETLLAEGLIEGEDMPPFGLMVSHVNGIRADFNLDGAFWEFRVNGQFSMQGVNDVYPEEGATYAFAFTPA